LTNKYTVVKLVQRLEEIMGLSGRVFRAAAVAFCFSILCDATVIYDSGVIALSPGSPTQFGRLSRNGIMADWSSVEPFPGDINTSTSYHFETYTIPIFYFPFIQISFDDVSGQANTFASAYRNSYNPSNKALNYLGDAGSSGNFFGVDPITFQVIVNPGNNLVVVVNDASAVGAGVGQPYRIIVEGFSDTNFNEASPEPATILLSGGGLGAALLAAQRRLKKTKQTQ
jgi:hypothetical protein